jgi:hypothetical protein
LRSVNSSNFALTSVCKTQLASNQQELQQLRLQNEKLIHRQHIQQQQLHVTQQELLAQHQLVQAQQFQEKQQELLAQQRQLQAQKKILEMQAMANYGSVSFLFIHPHFLCERTLTRTRNPFVRSVTTTSPTKSVSKQPEFNLLGTFEKNVPSIQSLDPLSVASFRDKTPTLSTSLPQYSTMASIKDKMSTMSTMSTSLPNRSAMAGVDLGLLSDLLASRETFPDTFGNYGSLRFARF